MGYVVNGVCVLALDEAHAVYFGSVPHLFSSDAANTYDTSYVLSASVGRSSASGWTRVTETRPAGGGAVTNTVYEDMGALSFFGCDPAGKFLDGVQLGWALSLAIVMVACVKILQRGL